MSDDVTNEKSQLRQRFRFERSQRNLGGDWLHLCRTDEIVSAKVIASYNSYGDEPETSQINDAILRMGKKLLLPRTDNQGVITWIEWGNNSRFEPVSRLSRKSSRVRQPIGNNFSGEIDVIICPALRVDRSGVRLGQGGGSYDRALSKETTTHSWKVALLHDEEISGELLPFHPHDVKVDAVALPEILVRFKK